jgi:hypothetical protein
MTKVFQVKELILWNGSVSTGKTKHYQTWETLNKWWPIRLKNAKNLTLRSQGYEGYGHSNMYGLEAYYNGQVIGSYRPWKSIDVPPVRPQQGNIFPALDRIELLAKSVIDKDIQRELLSSAAEVKNTLGI